MIDMIDTIAQEEMMQANASQKKLMQASAS